MADFITPSSSLKHREFVLRDTDDKALDRGSAPLTWTQLYHEGHSEYWTRFSCERPQGDRNNNITVILHKYCMSTVV